MALTFRPLTRDDFPLLTTWLEEPRVKRWWNHETNPEAVERDFGPGTRGEEPGEDPVVLLGDRPIGLLQRSVIRDYPEEYARFSAHVDVPPGAVELDYLIGDPDLRGRGLGTRLIRAAVMSTACAPGRAGRAHHRERRECRVVAGGRESGTHVPHGGRHAAGQPDRRSPAPHPPDRPTRTQQPRLTRLTTRDADGYSGNC